MKRVDSDLGPRWRPCPGPETADAPSVLPAAAARHSHASQPSNPGGPAAGPHVCPPSIQLVPVSTTILKREKEETQQSPEASCAVGRRRAPASVGPLEGSRALTTCLWVQGTISAHACGVVWTGHPGPPARAMLC
ncbi:hypothetical protein GHT09_013541 [Marmota monax]|uniref:Uncharacterized protein n=1 Tax=Marmota monax TaxID=9995 RepID=A0A834QCL5_MARMO|nr:hypothetical protein GHT09_013541 [Marmota monax]